MVEGGRFGPLSQVANLWHCETIFTYKMSLQTHFWYLKSITTLIEYFGVTFTQLSRFFCSTVAALLGNWLEFVGNFWVDKFILSSKILMIWLRGRFSPLNTNRMEVTMTNACDLLSAEFNFQPLFNWFFRLSCSNSFILELLIHYLSMHLHFVRASSASAIGMKWNIFWHFNYSNFQIIRFLCGKTC